MRLTNDLDGYTDLSIAADGSSVAAIRRATVDNLWVARVEPKAEAQPITFASGSAGSIGNLAPPGSGTRLPIEPALPEAPPPSRRPRTTWSSCGASTPTGPTADN